MAFRLLKDALPAQSRVSERQEKYAQVDQGCDLHENGQNVVPQHVDSRIWQRLEQIRNATKKFWNEVLVLEGKTW